jgi:acetyltransferase
MNDSKLTSYSSFSPLASAPLDSESAKANPLHSFFYPQAVAVIGASQTEGSVGRTLLWNLISNPFGGMVFPVNPKRSSVLGIKAYPKISEVPICIDLAIIVTPAASVPSIIKECALAGVRHVIVISAGFKEMGEPGIALENEIKNILLENQMTLIGPNCLGLMCPISGLNATFAKGMASKGHVAFLSQSGALLSAVLDWSLKEEVGFSACLSLGSMLDVSWGDLIRYFGSDPHTHSILIYMETIGDASAFLSAAREVALNKPIIIIKAGRTEAAAKAAASHTGSLTGSDEVLNAAFERAGVMRVDTIADLFNMAEVLSKQPLPKGPRLQVITNAGGPAVLATDALIQSGAQLAPLSLDLINELNTVLPASWSHANPVDILGDADANRYQTTLEILAKDTNFDGTLVILTPQDMTEPQKTAQFLAAFGQTSQKPILASWMGAKVVEEGVKILNLAKIPTFENPDAAATTFSHMWRYSQNLKNLYETPLPYDDLVIRPEDRAHAESIILKAQESGRLLLTEIESKQLLACYHLPISPIEHANSWEESVLHAEKIGFPVVLKVHSETISHKTDVGGIALNLKDSQEVKEAYQRIENSITQKVGACHFQGVCVQSMITFKDSYELIIGSSYDSQFGPVLMFGLGGQLVEVFKDYSLALPPLTTSLARQMMKKTKIYQALKGIRGRNSTDLKALENLLVRFSQLIADQPLIAEIEINPLLINDQQMMILDARTRLFSAQQMIHQPPKLAIRPYPHQYKAKYALKNSQIIEVRPIRSEDEPLIAEFYDNLANHLQQICFFEPSSLSNQDRHEKLIRLCCRDYAREITLLALSPENQSVIAIARIKRLEAGKDADLSLLVHERWQKQGLGSFLLSQLIVIAQQEKITQVNLKLTSGHAAMLKLAQNFNFETEKRSSNLTSEESHQNEVLFLMKKLD